MQEIQETWARSLAWEDPLEEEMAPHSSIAWKIPWTEEPGGLQSMESKESDMTEHARRQATKFGAVFQVPWFLLLRDTKLSLLPIPAFRDVFMLWSLREDSRSFSQPPTLSPAFGTSCLTLSAGSSFAIHCLTLSTGLKCLRGVSLFSSWMLISMCRPVLWLRFQIFSSAHFAIKTSLNIQLFPPYLSMLHSSSSYITDESNESTLSFRRTCCYMELSLLRFYWASLVAQLVNKLPAMRETWVQSLGWEDSLEEGTATHSSILAWRILWTVTWLSDFHFHLGFISSVFPDDSSYDFVVYTACSCCYSENDEFLQLFCPNWNPIIPHCHCCYCFIC